MKTVERMSSERMAIAVLNDSQFHLPKYPKVSKNFSFIKLDGERMVVIGTAEKQLLRGNGVNTILPYVLENCDGSKSVKDILLGSNYSKKDIFQVLSLLYARGLLQEGYIEKRSLVEHPLYHIYDRLIDGTRQNKNVVEAIKKLSNSMVTIQSLSIENSTIMRELEQQLTLCGINVEIQSEFELVSSDKNNLVVGICDSLQDINKWHVVAEQYYHMGIKFLCVLFNETNLIVAPLIEKYETICFECFVSQLERLNITSSIKIKDSLIEIGISLIVPEISNLLSNINISPITNNCAVIYDLQLLKTEIHTFTRSPSCRICNAEKATQIKDSTVYQYESMIEFPSRQYLNLKDHQNHYKSSNLQLTRDYKNYFSSPRISLKENNDLPTLKQTFDSESEMDKLTKVLLFTTGVKASDPYKIKRWCPTGGNLGSVQLYFLNISIKQLKKSIYFYQVMDHELVQVTRPLKDCDIEKIHRTDNEQSLIGYFIFTGSIKRVAKKYHELSYRLVNLDAGVAFAQCQVVSKSIGWSLKRIINFDEKSICEQLGIYDIGEIITLIAEINGGNDHA